MAAGTKDMVMSIFKLPCLLEREPTRLSLALRVFAGYIGIGHAALQQLRSQCPSLRSITPLCI
jgi:hypothetical protein